MTKAPDRATGEDGLPVPPYALYNIGNNHPENLLDFVQTLSEELVRAGVLPEDYDFRRSQGTCTDAARGCSGNLCRYICIRT